MRNICIDYLGAGYYIVEMTDIRDHLYESNACLMQKPDTIAPAAPIGLTASRASDGTVTLKWTKNTDNDLLGYKVYFSYYESGPYQEVTSSYVLKNEFQHRISDDNPNSFAYYKVAALDKVKNQSVKSNQAVVGIPDVAGLPEPIITQLVPRPEGMRVGWALGQAKVTLKYTLQRKLKSETKWGDVLTWKDPVVYNPLPVVSPELQPSNYIDTDLLQHKYYDYRLKVSDDTRVTYSRKVTAKAYDNGLRGVVTNFTATILPANAYYTDYEVPPFADNTAAVSVQKKPDGVVARLNWQYTTQYASSLREFKIYVKDNVNTSDAGGTYTLVKSVPKQIAQMTAQVTGGTGYSAHLSRLKFKLNIPKKIKIIAYHNDGGFSEVVEVVLNP